MDLCIGILVYELDPSPLLKQIIAQIERVSAKTYILIHDDGSAPSWQEKLKNEWSKDPRVELSLSAVNQGRSKARNTLLKKADAHYLLMIDGDAQIEDPDFLEKYWASAQSKTVSVGGKKLANTKATPNCELRWLYAQQREIRSVAKRKERGFLSFQSNCFLMDLGHLEGLYFDEKLLGYGHEDSLFGLRLKDLDWSINHIDLPTIYQADEASPQFLAKTEQALSNLLYIKEHYPHYAQYFPLLIGLNKIKSWRLTTVALGLYHLGGKRFYSNLCSSKPSLKVFDLYRLLRLLELDRSNKGS